MAAVTHAVATASTSNTTSYATGSFTPAAGDLLICFVVASGTVAAGSVTDSQNLGWTKVTSALKNSSADTLYCFVSNTTAAASSMTITFSCTGDAATGAVVSVARISGMSKTGSGAIKQSAKQENQASGTPAPAFSASALTGNPTLGLVGNGANPATLTAPTNWTERSDTGYNTPTTGSEYVSRDSGFTGTTVTWGSSSGTAFGSIIIELDTTNNGTLSKTQAGDTLSATGTVSVTGSASITQAGNTLTSEAGGHAVETLTDNFDDNSRDTAKWDQYLHKGGGSDVSVSETSGRVEVTLVSQSQQSEGGYVSANRFALYNSSLFVAVPVVPGGNAYTIFSITGNQFAQFRLVAGTLYFDFNGAGGSLAYDASAHYWWRIRHAVDTYYWDTAPATASNPPSSGDWVNRYSTLSPDTDPDGFNRVYLNAGTDELVASPGKAVFDGFNTAANPRGTLTATQASDSISAAGTVAAGGVTGTLSQTQASDSLTASAAVAVAATASQAQASQTISAVGTVLVTATADQTQAADTISAAGTVAVAATLTASQSEQTVSAAGTVAVAATLSKTQDDQTISSTGTVAVAGTLTATQAGDTLSSAGTVAVAVSLSATQANQTLSAAGSVAIAATLSATQSDQGISSAGSVAIAGSASLTQADQTIAATGTVGSSEITATLSATQSSDALSASGSVAVAGTLDATQAAQSVSGAGSVRVLGTLDATQSADSLSAAGTVGDVSTGTLDASQAGDSISAAASVRVTGSLSAASDGDSISASGAVHVVAILAQAASGDSISAAGAVRIVGTLTATQTNTISAAATLYARVIFDNELLRPLQSGTSLAPPQTGFVTAPNQSGQASAAQHTGRPLGPLLTGRSRTK